MPGKEQKEGVLPVAWSVYNSPAQQDEQDFDWQVVRESYDPLKLLKLLEKFILKQSDYQCKIGINIKQSKLLLAYWQDDGATNAAFYN